MLGRLLCLVAVLLALTGAVAQVRLSSVSSAGLSNTSQWMTESWTGNTRPYKRAMSEVRGAIGAARDPAAVVASYKAAAQRNPQDALAQFRWAYSAYRINHTDPAIRASGELSQAAQALASVASPKMYEFARLRFVLEAMPGGYIYPLKTVGMRLLKRDPMDKEVKYWLTQVLDDGPSDQDHQQALSYSQELTHSKGYEVYGYQALGWTYFVILGESHRQQDGDAAIAAYRQAERYAPSDAEFHAGAERLIHLIQTSQAHMKK